MVVVLDEELYEHSKVIINTTSATYENRLSFINKTSKMTGTYTCQVVNSRGSWNESLYLEGIYLRLCMYIIAIMLCNF